MENEEKSRRNGEETGPGEGKKPKPQGGERFFHVLVILMIIIFAALIGLKFADRYRNRKKYDDMMQTTVAAETTTAKAATTAASQTTAKKETTTAAPTRTPEPDFLTKIDFNALKQRNSDVVGWIYIPDTVISYPVLWKQNDNDYYLHRDIDKKSSYEGIFLDGADKPDFSEKQNLIYGHHMKNGTMFAGLSSFKEQSYFMAHRTVYLYTPAKTYRLRTMACMYTGSGAEKRKISFADQTEFDAYVDQMTKDCAFREIPAGGISQLFALVTCSYEYSNARTILYCYEADMDGKPVKSTAPANPSSAAGNAGNSTAAAASSQSAASR